MVIGVLSSLAIIMLRKRGLVALLALCCICLFSVFLPYGTVGWPVVCDCGIHWSYSFKPQHVISNNVVF